MNLVDDPKRWERDLDQWERELDRQYRRRYRQGAMRRAVNRLLAGRRWLVQQAKLVWDWLGDW